MKQLILIFTLLIISGCSISTTQKQTNRNISNIDKEKLVQTFIPVKVKDGLIEIERKDVGKYITPDMVLIEECSFQMGDITNSGTTNEQPVKHIQIKNKFFISKKEITFKEYDKFVKDTKRVPPNDEGMGRDNNPVVNVSYEDVKAYLDWLSKQTGDTYRLPTEAEWECSAKAGSKSRFFFGDSVKDLKHYSWYWDNAQNGIHEVGTKLPNMWGLYDMAGNVWEWCEDYFVDSLEFIPSDGRAYDISTGERVVKGGSWNEYGINLRHSNRLGFSPTIKMNDTGFRVVMEYK